MKSQKSGLIIYQISQKAELAVVAVNRVTESEAPKYWALDFSQNTAAGQCSRYGCWQLKATDTAKQQRQRAAAIRRDIALQHTV